MAIALITFPFIGYIWIRLVWILGDPGVYKSTGQILRVFNYRDPNMVDFVVG
jgi:hypothetical protein